MISSSEKEKSRNSQNHKPKPLYSFVPDKVTSTVLTYASGVFLVRRQTRDVIRTWPISRIYAKR